MPEAGRAVGTALCTGAASVALWAAVHERRVLSRLRRHGVRTVGTVLRTEIRDTSEPIRVPVIEFTDGDGRRQEFRPGPAGAGLHLPVGSRVPVVFLPEDPKTVRVFTTRYRVVPAVVLMVTMTAFLGAGAMIAASR